MNRHSKLVILDRDGVINQDSDAYIKSPEEWIAIEGSLESIADLSKAGYTITVATNQSGIARKLFDDITLARIHQKMGEAIEGAGGLLDGVFFCPHGPEEGCHCRKPGTGLLEAIASEYDVSLVGIPLVGDSLKDIQAAKKAGCRPFLVKTGKGMDTLASCKPQDLEGVQVVDSLRAATRIILGEPC